MYNNKKTSLTSSSLRRQPLCLSQILPVEERIKTFPTTRYYGSKRKLLPWIFEKTRALSFDTVLDGFGGTGSVSLLFKAMGKNVSYHDAFCFNEYAATSVLCDNLAVNINTFEEFLLGVGEEEGFISKHYRGMYYTDEENAWLDGFARKLFSSGLSQQQRAVYLYTVFQACLKKRPFNLFHRANLNLRLKKDISRRFGNLTTWEKTFNELMLQSYNELASSVWRDRHPVQILHSRDIAEIKAIYDLVYLDPPYVSLNEKDNNDDYWRKYHFLESLSQYPDWELNGDSKIPAAPKHFREWNKKKHFEEKLFHVIEKHSNSIVALSYITDAYPEEKRIKDYFESLFPDVSVHVLPPYN